MNYDEFYGWVNIINIMIRSLNVIYCVELYFIKFINWVFVINEILYDYFYIIMLLYNMF